VTLSIYSKMAAPDLEDGNLRSSHRESSAVKLKFANSFLHDLATQFVETRIKDCCIRQRLQPDKEQIVKRGTFYVMENESRSDPGFLLLLPKQPAVFMMTRPSGQNKKIPAWTLRMRTDVRLGEGGGTMLIATLDKIQHTLRLEDVWVWKGEDTYNTKKFSERRSLLKTFVEDCWTPDARLMGGIQCSVANPKPLASLATIENCFSVDLIPELPGKRRFWFQLQTPTNVPPASMTAPMFRTTAPVLHDTTPATGRVEAYAVPLESLPDVYDLFLENGTALSRAAVQQLSLSQKLKAIKGRIPVIAEWKSEFGRYEIVEIRPSK
jgi:hypothetical protein